jgi:hypothetical protein
MVIVADTSPSSPSSASRGSAGTAHRAGFSPCEPEQITTCATQSAGKVWL